MRHLRTVIALAAATCCGLVAQQPIRIVTLDGSRIGLCNSIPMAFTGPLYRFARGSLSSTTNFGPNGIVRRTVQITPAPRFDLATLSIADVVVIGPGRITDFDPHERTLLASFVLAGGGIVWFENNVANASVDLLGGTPGLSPSPLQAVVTDPTSPMVNGPFVRLPVGTQMQHSYNGSFATVGPHGSTVMAVGGDTFAATFSIGAGRVAAFGDEEIFVSTSVSGCAAATWTFDWSRVFPQTVAWVAPAPGFAFTAQDIVFRSYGNACDGGTGSPPALTAGGENIGGGSLRYAIRNAASSQPCALLLGLSQTALPILGCDLLVINFLGSGVMSSTSPQGIASFSFVLPAGLSGTIHAQAVVLDQNATNLVTATNGERDPVTR